MAHCWVAKKLMSHTFSVKFRVLEENFSETILCIGLKFSEITETVMPFQYSVFILLASSDSDKCMLMRQKV